MNAPSPKSVNFIVPLLTAGAVAACWYSPATGWIVAKWAMLTYAALASLQMVCWLILFWAETPEGRKEIRHEPAWQSAMMVVVGFTLASDLRSAVPPTPEAVGQYLSQMAPKDRVEFGWKLVESVPSEDHIEPGPGQAEF